jgi:hypothetical protein
LLAAVAVFLLFPIGQVAVRWAYYGTFVPNTYVLKVEGFPLLLRIRNGLAYLQPFVGEFRVFSLIAGLAVLLDYSWKKLLVLTLFAASIAYTVVVGGDAWRNWRFIAPYLPSLFAVVVLEIHGLVMSLAPEVSRGAGVYLSRNPIWEVPWVRALAQRGRLSAFRTGVLVAALLIVGSLAVDPLGLGAPGFGREQKLLLVSGIILLLALLARRLHLLGGKGARIPAAGAAVAILFVGGLVLADARFLSEVFFRTLPFDVEWNAQRVAHAIAITELTSQSAQLGVAAAGTIPFYTGRFSIDFLGKADPVIAARSADVSGAVRFGTMIAWPGHNKYDLNYSIGELRPTYVQLLPWGADDLCSLLGSVYLPVDYAGVRLYLRKDSRDVDWSAVQDKGVVPPVEGACSKRIP